jgi:putative ATP-binding cassette transporter
MKDRQPLRKDPFTAAANSWWMLRRLYRGSHTEGWAVLAMMISVFVVIVFNTVMQVRLNEWKGQFYNALQDRNFAAFLNQLGLFLVIVGILLALGVAQTWVTETMKVKARRWVTSGLLEAWLMPRRAYLLRFAGEIGHNPDQRITEDVRRLADQSIGLLVGLGQSTLLLASFVGVLWHLSAEVVFTYQGSSFTIPGYMVWCALAFTFIGSGLTYLFGRPLIAINAELYAREGAFRTALVNINEHAEGISLDRGECDERNVAKHRLSEVLKLDQALASMRARLTWVTAGYGWIGLIAPIIVAAPGYFSNSMTLGDLMMVVGAFMQVQNALRWFIDHYPSIAEWQAVLSRVTLLLRTLDRLEAASDESGAIELGTTPDGTLALDHLMISPPGDESRGVSVGHQKYEIAPGERVLFVGPPDSGKTALFMALAGLWPWGRGTIRLPYPFAAMFVPERPYVPLGTLRHAIAYPAPESDFTPEQIHAVMRDAGIAHLVPRCGAANQQWSKDLSVGDQQRFAVARLLLHKPEWVVLDNSLSALDEEAQNDILALLRQRLPDSAVISTSRRRFGERFYGRVIELGINSAQPAFTPVLVTNEGERLAV